MLIMNTVVPAVSDEVRREEALRRVRLGYAWMKERGPEFGVDVSRINIDTLNLRSWCDCALGQAMGRTEFGLALQLLIAADAIPNTRLTSVHTPGTAWSIERGFNTRSDDMSIYAEHLVNGILLTYDDLNRAWKQVIEEDRATA